MRIPDSKARETHRAIKIPVLAGLWGTRALTHEIPGIGQLVTATDDLA